MRCSTRETATKYLREFGFAAFFCDLVARCSAASYPDDLRSHFESPSEFFRLLNESPTDFPHPDFIVPIRESNHDFFVCYLRPPHDLYIEHSIEWAPDKFRVIARTHDEYLEYELDHLWFAELDVAPMRRCLGLQPD